jgi:hypothetical protein
VVVPIAPGRRPLVLESIRRLVSESHEVLVDEGPNPSRNRNRSIRRARAGILGFTDDDCVVTPQWLTNAAAFFRAHPDYDVVGGPQLNLDEEGLLGRTIGHALGSRFGTYRTNGRFTRRRLRLDATQFDLTSANLFITRRAFEKWGPFDERLWPNEESRLLDVIERAGGRIAYDPSIVVRHKRRNSLWQFARQCFGYGSGRARQTRIESSLPGVGQMVPVAFLVYLLMLPALSLSWPGALGPLALYSAISASVSAVAAFVQRDWRAAPVMPFVFLTIHIAYPAGFLVEAMRMTILGHDLSESDRESTKRKRQPGDERAADVGVVAQSAPCVRTVEFRR